MMQTTVRLILAALLCAGAAATRAAGTLAEIPVFVLADPETERHEVAQQPIGPAIIRLVAQESGLNLVARPYPWRRAQAMAESGSGLLYGAAKTPERQRVFHFTQPFDSVNQWLVSTSASPLAFDRWEDLRGKIVSIMSGGKFSDAFEQRRGTLFQVAQDSTSMGSRLRMLRAGRVDAVMVASFLGAPELERKLNCLFPDREPLVIVGKPIDVEPVMLVVPRSPPLNTLFPVLDAAAKRIAAAGGLHALHVLESSDAPCPVPADGI